MQSRNYYTLIAGLPFLPRFDHAQRLPINRERLLQRLTMLDPQDMKLAEKAAEFIAWRRQPVGRTEQEVVKIYHQLVEQLYRSPLLKNMFEFPINQRTIMAALRMRNKGAPHPSDHRWGVGDLVGHIERNWDDPTFKLGFVFPWIAQAQTYLKEGESLQLEYLLMDLMWDKLDRMLFKNFFGFEVLIAYLLKWDITQQWLSYNKIAAKSRFEKLLLEIVDEYEKSHT